jgi:hypothetical protein
VFRCGGEICRISPSHSGNLFDLVFKLNVYIFLKSNITIALSRVSSLVLFQCLIHCFFLYFQSFCEHILNDTVLINRY